MGQMMEHAMTIRCAAAVSLAFVGVRRALEIAGFRAADVQVGEACSVVGTKVRCQKNDQFGVGQIARVVALASWGGACPVRLVSEWLWFRAWLARNRDHSGRLATLMEDSPLFPGLARARFGLEIASFGASASWEKGFDGRGLFPRKGGARFYVVNGMAREATQELGGWKSPAVMEGVYTRARSEEVVPEMRAAVAKACAGLEVERFVEDLDRDVCVESSEALGAERGAEARVWRQRFRSVRDLLLPSVVLPIREDFWSLMGRRARALKLTTRQMREILSRGSSYRSELRRRRSEEPRSAARAKEREAAVRPAPNKQARHIE